MPRRKQKIPIEENNSNDVTPLRRSNRKPVKEKKKGQKPLSTIESNENSLDSANSGISPGLSSKNETLSPAVSKTSTANKDLSSDESVNCNEVQRKKPSKKVQQQRNKKRKVDDLDDSALPNKKKKQISKKKLISKDVSSESIDISLQLQPVKKELYVEVNNNSTIADEVANSSSIKEETILQVLTQHEFEANTECKISNTKISKTDNDSSSDSDWEKVEERKEQRLEDYNPVIPKEGVEITIDCPELNVRKRKKKQFDHMEYIRLYINRGRKEAQLNVHKTHLLCLLAHGLYVNNVLNSPNLKALALSYLPPEMLAITIGRKIDKANSNVIYNLVSWFCENFSFESKLLPFIDFEKNIQVYFEKKKSLSSSEYNLMFLVFARTLGFKTRFCVSFYPVSHKATNLLKKPGSKKKSVSQTHNNSEEEQNVKVSKNSGSSKKEIVSQTQHNSEEEQNVKVSKPSCSSKKKSVKKEETKSDYGMKINKSHRSARKSYKISSEEDEDFVDKTPKKAKKVLKKSPNRKVLSSDSEIEFTDSTVKKDKIVCWCEVFSKPDKQWISIECTNKISDKPYDIEKLLQQPAVYILAYDNDSYIKDVTKRYCSEYMTSTLKLRPDSDWWEETLEYFSPPNSKLNKEEEKKLDEILVNKPLPKTIGEYKNHPLYALKRHLLKFEAIYPPDAAPIGYIREEPVYARDNVCKLHSRETWVKEARVVRAGEEPYKIVKARPKWDRLAGVMKTDLPLEVFGFWQTNEYEPSVAEGGKVPRNEYGNVELFKPCMLPRGTVHLQIPGLNRVAKKLGIDCSPAVVGFDGHKGSIHPVFDGFVVCKEFKDTLLAAWDEEQENARKREKEKREKRIYGNWKKLIKGLLIRERIKLKYDVK